jgi:hypothetical protein
MGTKDPRIDAYITRQAAFARPILRTLRQLCMACPQVETLGGSSEPIPRHPGGMAAFKQHAAFVLKAS